jgi:ABC-type multidrug transport system ATPase subunit
MDRCLLFVFDVEIGIMKMGQFVCLGNLQRLKNRFGNGYAVQVKLPVKDVDRFKEELIANVPGVVVQGKWTVCVMIECERMSIALQKSTTECCTAMFRILARSRLSGRRVVGQRILLTYSNGLARRTKKKCSKAIQ